eukprot:20601-Pelagococcus_subviridis.AAC.2
MPYIERWCVVPFVSGDKSIRHDSTPSESICVRKRARIVGHRNGLAFTTSREFGTAARSRPQTLRTRGVTLASALKQPKVTKPAVMHGAGATGGASALGLLHEALRRVQRIADGVREAVVDGRQPRGVGVPDPRRLHRRRSQRHRPELVVRRVSGELHEDVHAIAPDRLREFALGHRRAVAPGPARGGDGVAQPRRLRVFARRRRVDEELDSRRVVVAERREREVGHAVRVEVGGDVADDEAAARREGSPREEGVSRLRVVRVVDVVGVVGVGVRIGVGVRVRVGVAARQAYEPRPSRVRIFATPSQRSPDALPSRAEIRSREPSPRERLAGDLLEPRAPPRVRVRHHRALPRVDVIQRQQIILRRVSMIRRAPLALRVRRQRLRDVPGVSE